VINLNLTGKSAIVTGGGIGIGREIVRTLAQAGASVGFTFHTHEPSNAPDEPTDRPPTISAHMDATHSDEVTETIASLAAQLGGTVDILVNNVGGLVSRVPVDSMNDSHWASVIDLNLASVFYCVRASLPYFNGPGRIVNISSLASQNGGGSGATAYAAAKGGVDAFSRALANELGPRAITVNAIAPGLILDTPFHRQFTPEANQQATIRATPIRRAGTPGDVAGAVLYLVSDLGAFTSGAVLDVNGGSYFH
jgi:3-oxoacyl-[acyl-carrier protein] reductase